MRRFVLTLAVSLWTIPALATMPGAGDLLSRAASELAQVCRAECQGRASRSVNTQAIQACDIRCGAAQSFAEGEGRDGVVASGRGTQTVSMPGTTPAAPNGHGVIYAARAPSSSFGMVVGEADRLAAYRVAERRCVVGGPGCRIIAEFTAACGAVAQGVRRSRGAFVMTSDPATYVVTSTSSGSASNRVDAETDALAECHSKDPQSTCWVVAAQCGTNRS
ncbi:MAG: hypothetical protein JWR10_4728 [Rubritepida sp.]|nr:hypothetical protein [Rubritepida sp.]